MNREFNVILIGVSDIWPKSEIGLLNSETKTDASKFHIFDHNELDKSVSK